MYKRNLILLVLVVALIALGIFVGMNFDQEDPAGASKYSMVSTITGEIYFGELSWFPRPKIKDAWTLQRLSAENGAQAQLSIVKTSDAFWQPVGDIYLNSKNIVSWTYLRNDSQVARALADPESVQNELPQGSALPEGIPRSPTDSLTP